MSRSVLVSLFCGLSALLLITACPEPTATVGDAGTSSGGDSGGPGCTDECNTGDRMVCTGGERTCGNWDEDACLEWSECTSTCTNKCGNSGEKRCASGGVETCGDGDGDGCLEWSAVVPCGAGETCERGECSCAEECPRSGDTRCVGDKFQECGNFDNDRCLEWSGERGCPQNETCSGDRCSASCSNDCASSGQKRCSGEGFQVCGHYDADSCLDWSGVTNCASFEECQNGVCAPSCTDECPRAGDVQCSGNGFQTCGNSDVSDPCLEWDAVTDCKPGETCSNGICAETCTDECSAGQKECSSDYPLAGTRECGEANDGDSCLDWMSSLCIPFLDMCRDGECVGHCNDECNFDGERQCAGDGYQICGAAYDNDVCLEWGPITSCAPDACSLGNCVGQCSDDCGSLGERVCSGDSAYRTCGEYDDDACLDLGGATSCGTGEQCQNGACVGACTDSCVWGDYGCTSNGSAEWWCYDEDGDGCVEVVETPCASGETCVADFCEPTSTTCTDDPYEPNDSRTGAAYIIEGTTAGLQVCAGDEDWYYLYLLAGKSLDVLVEFTHADGDLDLKVVDDNNAVIGRSVTVNDDESASVQVTTSGYYYIQVYGYSGAENGYSLTVAVTSGAGCTDDSHEENDNQSAASYLTEGVHSGLQLCAGDDDWYEMYLLSGDSLDALLTFSHADGDLDLRIEDDAGAVVDSGVSVTDNEDAQVPTVSSSGYYYLRVYGANSSVENSYSLDVDLTYTPICYDDMYEDNDSLGTAERLTGITTGLNNFYGLQICAGDDDWYEVFLYSGETLTVDLMFTHSADGDLDLYFYDQTESELASSASGTDDEQVQHTVSSTGYYYVKVIGYQADDENSYDMILTLN